MTLVEHLYELRFRLGLAVVALICGGIIGFLWFQYSVGSIPTLGELMKGPYCQLPANVRANINTPGSGHACQLLQTKPFEAFTIRLKIGLMAGAVLSSPFWFYQIWAFVTPGLLRKERAFAGVFVLFASVLFAAGAVVAYIVIPEALKVLTTFGAQDFATAFAADDYVSFLLTLLIIFGVSFELPLVVVMLNRVGVLPYDTLKKWRRGIVFVLFVFAALVTPGGDALSMMALAGALTVLFELSIQISRLNDRRKARLRVAEGWDGLDDDEASPLDYKPEPVSPIRERAERSTGERSTPERYDDVT